MFYDHFSALGDMRTGAPMDRISVDLMGPLPLTKRNNHHILVATDSFSKWVEIFPVPDQTATTCAKILLNEIIARFGCPVDVHSDQGRNFESQDISRFVSPDDYQKNQNLTKTSPGKWDRQSILFLP